MSMVGSPAIRTPDPADPDPVLVRERGLRLAARAKGWMIAGALALAGALTGLTAHAFHARSPARSAAAASPGRAAAGGDAAPLTPPTSTPAPAQAPAPAPVSSGGS